MKRRSFFSTLLAPLIARWSNVGLKPKYTIGVDMAAKGSERKTLFILESTANGAGDYFKRNYCTKPFPDYDYGAEDFAQACREWVHKADA